MSNQLTPMQELINELDDTARLSTNPIVTTTINLIIDVINSKLPKEQPKESTYDWFLKKHGIEKGSSYILPTITFRQCAGLINEHHNHKKSIEGKYLNVFKEKCLSGDIEINHSEADDILCDLLEELGYTELVTEFKKLKKYYA